MRNNIKSSRLRINYGTMFKNILILLLIFFTISLFTTKIFSKNELMTKTITVEKNQTMWSIAKSICRNDTNLDVQQVIYDIKNMNKINDSIIYEGQNLIIPEY